MLGCPKDICQKSSNIVSPTLFPEKDSQVWPYRQLLPFQDRCMQAFDYFNLGRVEDAHSSIEHIQFFGQLKDNKCPVRSMEV